MKKCLQCNRTMRKVNRKYHFRGCGLDNVYLSGIPVYKCTSCGDTAARIPMMGELLKTIGEAVVNKPAPLSGPEIRFLRKNAKMLAETFVKYLGVDPSTYSRWENGKAKVGRTSDRLIRLCYATLMEYEDQGRILAEFLNLMDETSKKRIDVTRSPLSRYNGLDKMSSQILGIRGTPCLFLLMPPFSSPLPPFQDTTQCLFKLSNKTVISHGSDCPQALLGLRNHDQMQVVSVDFSPREFSTSDGPVNWLSFNPLPDASELIGWNTPFSARACDGPVRRPAPTVNKVFRRRGGSPYPPEEPTDWSTRQHQRKRTTGGDSSANYDSVGGLVRNPG